LIGSAIGRYICHTWLDLNIIYSSDSISYLNVQ
jgi:hypothetical protein